MGDSLKDDEDDEDFEEDGEDEDDDDLSSDDEETPKKVNKKVKLASDDSRVEDEDDEDFEEGSDDEGSDDESPKKGKTDKKKKGPKKELNESTESNLTPEEKSQRDKRTVFVGNIPKDATKLSVKKLFRPFGLIETVRVRGIVPENPKHSFKAASITGKTHPKVTSVWMYVTYKEEESAKKALSMNGKKLDNNILRVDSAYEQVEIDPKKGVFLGNLPFGKFSFDM